MALGFMGPRTPKKFVKDNIPLMSKYGGKSRKWMKISDPISQGPQFFSWPNTTDDRLLLPKIYVQHGIIC